MKNIVYFDLETQLSATEVGGWNNISKMLMSIGVTYSTATGAYEIYDEKRVDALIDELQKADLVVGYNHIRFDYEVLHHYTALDLRQIPSLDMLLELQKTMSHRLSLDSIATGTLGVQKTSDGLQALDHDITAAINATTPDSIAAPATPAISACNVNHNISPAIRSAANTAGFTLTFIVAPENGHTRH